MDLIHRLPIALFTFFIGKLLFIKPDLSDALIVVAMAALVASVEYGLHKKKENQFNEKLKKIEEQLEQTKKIAEDCRTSIMGVKLQQGIRSTGR